MVNDVFSWDEWDLNGFMMSKDGKKQKIIRDNDG